MHVDLHPLVAPTGRLRVWIGVSGTDDVPSLTWKVSPGAETPEVLRPLSKLSQNASGLRSMTGVYEFATLVATSERRHRVEVCAATDTDLAEASVDAWDLPAGLSTDQSTPFNVLLTSCYYQPHDAGVSDMIATQLSRGPDRPDLVVAVGDQVYLDNPWYERVPRNHEDLARWLERKYRSNWSATSQGERSLHSLLKVAPAALIPDDHEYWNNYPNPASFKMSTWAPWAHDRQKQWKQTARTLFEGYQLAGPGEYQRSLEIDPLSIYLMDNRTFRQTGDRTTLGRAGPRQFEEWVGHVLQNDRIPVIVTGPSLLQPKANRFMRRVADRNLANYQDYTIIIDGLRTLLNAGRTVLALTGDVHYGRVTTATCINLGTHRTRARGHLIEVIASPSALVQTARPRAEMNPFTLHAARQCLLHCNVMWPDEQAASRLDDHVALLRFWRTPWGVQVSTTYYLVRRGYVTHERMEAPPISLFLREP